MSATMWPSCSRSGSSGTQGRTHADRRGVHDEAGRPDVVGRTDPCDDGERCRTLGRRAGPVDDRDVPCAGACQCVDDRSRRRTGAHDDDRDPGDVDAARRQPRHEAGAVGARPERRAVVTQHDGVDRVERARRFVDLVDDAGDRLLVRHRHGIARRSRARGIAAMAAPAPPSTMSNATNRQSRPASSNAALCITGDSDCLTGEPITAANRVIDGSRSEQTGRAPRHVRSASCCSAVTAKTWPPCSFANT